MKRCYFCKSEETVAINTAQRNEELTGAYDWVPELPNVVNVCWNHLDKLDYVIKKKVRSFRYE